MCQTYHKQGLNLLSTFSVHCKFVTNQHYFHILNIRSPSPALLTNTHNACKHSAFPNDIETIALHQISKIQSETSKHIDERHNVVIASIYVLTRDTQYRVNITCATID